MNPTFNLIDKPWLPCIHIDDNLVELSLREALTQAHQIQQIHGETPLITAALHRLLLAILHRVFGPDDPALWEEFWKAGQWNEIVLNNYFEKWYARFDLFDSKYPFYQAPTPPAVLKLKSVSKLAPEMAAGNNATLFDHTCDDTLLSFSASEAARRLVTIQTFSVGGGQSGIPGKYFSHSACTKGILFLIQGKNLYETLTLNLPLYDLDLPIPGNDKDCPAWEMDNPLIPDRNIPFGYLDYLTWQSRTIKLIPFENDGEIRVNQMYFSQGLWLKTFIESPMHAIRKTKEAGRVPLTFDENRVLWRDSASLFNLKQSDKLIEPPAIFDWVANFVGDEFEGLLGQDQIYQYMAIGLKTDEQNPADVKFYRFELMPLPLALLKKPNLVETLRNALQVGEEANKTLYFASKELAVWLVSPIKGKADPRDYKPIIDHLNLEHHYWASLEVSFKAFVQDLPADPGAALDRWRDVVIRTARSSFNQATNGIDDPNRGLKAVVLGRQALERGLSKIKPRENQAQLSR